MSLIIKLIIESSIIFIFVFLFNYFQFIKKNKELNHDDMPLELIYLSSFYKIDPKKISFKKFQYTYSLVNAFIITTTYMIVIYLIKTMLMKVILGIVILILLIVISYGLLGRYYLYKEEKSSKKRK